jgi:hypothetical protein
MPKCDVVPGMQRCRKEGARGVNRKGKWLCIGTTMDASKRRVGNQRDVGSSVFGGMRGRTVTDARSCPIPPPGEGVKEDPHSSEDATNDAGLDTRDPHGPSGGVTVSPSATLCHGQAPKTNGSRGPMVLRREHLARPRKAGMRSSDRLRRRCVAKHHRERNHGIADRRLLESPMNARIAVRLPSSFGTRARANPADRCLL